MTKIIPNKPDAAFPKLMIGFEVSAGGWHRTIRKRRMDRARTEAITALGWTLVDLNAQRTTPEMAAQKIVERLTTI